MSKVTNFGIPFFLSSEKEEPTAAELRYNSYLQYNCNETPLLLLDICCIDTCLRGKCHVVYI